jgi:predicted nucleotidyltransferase
VTVYTQSQTNWEIWEAVDFRFAKTKISSSNLNFRVFRTYSVKRQTLTDKNRENTPKRKGLPASDLRCRVAREAAVLLYFGAEKEYKQAKLKAAEALRVHVLPTNLEVALELDMVAEENEGSARKERLIRMRKEALRIMKQLKAYHPVLIGSVWRGTIRRGSDIDIAVYHDAPEEIVTLLKKTELNVSSAEWVTVTKSGQPEASFHIHALTLGGQKVEVVVRGADEASRRRKCEVFGDELKGLSVVELEKVIGENPAQKFVPL